MSSFQISRSAKVQILASIAKSASHPEMPRPLSASAKVAPVNSLEPMNLTKDGFPLHPYSERLERRKGLLDTSFIQRVRARKEQSDSESLADSESDANASNVSSAISQGSQSGHSDESDDEEDEASEEVRIRI